jgi:hypothetical protein
MSLCMDMVEFDPIHAHGQALIQPYPCIGTTSNSTISMHRDMPEFKFVSVHGQGWTRPNSSLSMHNNIVEFGPVPMHGQGWVWPCPCVGIGLNLGFSFEMDRE